jgi:GNAT superfamily N-acetyltransferase
MADDRIATRTYLEMKTPAALRPARAEQPNLTVKQDEQRDPALWRRLYTEVGRDHRWVDRLPWTDADAAAYLHDPHVTLWLFFVDARLAGYFELRSDRDAAVEIVYFGLLPDYTGRGLGGHLLTEAVERAWASGASRVWLHTCSFDHPAAIPNYLSRGFTIVKTEEYLVDPSLS